jgi:single-strand DNA-binding protein
MNIVVLSGHLSSDPTSRELASGSVLMTLELTTRVDGVAISVPLVWFDPPARVAVASGDEVRAVGTVRRRFYRAGGATQSRTEVVVAHLGKAGDKRSTAAQRRWLDNALADTGETAMGRAGVEQLRSS